jgi:hypothetical protein
MNYAFRRLRHRWFGVVAVAVASGTAGWALGQGHDEGRPAPVDSADARAAAVAPVPAAHRSDPEIWSFADGTISVHVDRVAIGWLMSELTRKGGVPEVSGPVAADDTVAVSDPSCEPADGGADDVDAERLERTLVEGTESERYAALTHALQAGVDLPPALLRQTYGSDPSESVRLLAFTTYVDSVSDDRTEVRAALQSGLYDSSSAMQAEAQRRLAELEQYERALAAASTQRVP